MAKKEFRPEYEYLIYKTLVQYRQKRPVRIATGCSGLETPILACIEMNIEVEHVFSSEVNQNARDSAERAKVQAEHVWLILARLLGCADLAAVQAQDDVFFHFRPFRGLEDQIPFVVERHGEGFVELLC